ncbi:MAG: addiction module protein [Limisphaerales bacterium]
MVLETLPEVKSLSAEQKLILTQELLDELHAPAMSPEQDQAILEVLDARFEAYQADPSTGSTWQEVRARLREKTGASWQK